MSRRRNQRSNRVQKQNLGGKLLIAGVAFILLAVFAFQWITTNKAEQFDKTTFCPKQGPDSVSAIMIDQTDPLSPIQKASLKNRLQIVQDTIPTHSRLEIYVIGNTVSKTLKPVFSMCNPGREKDINPLFGNPKHIEQKWKSSFDKPINDILDRLLSAPASKESPILESIQSIAVTAFNNPNTTKADHHLIIASDMIHYTPQFSLYQTPSKYTALRNTNYFQKIHSDLRDVDVKILLFRHSINAKVQNPDFIQFWEAFFQDQGASLENIYAISG